MTIEDVRNARKSAKIADIDDFSMRAAVQDILREVSNMNGMDYTLVVNVTSLLYNKLRREFGNLTIDEVQLAFRAGTEGEFGKNYSITYATIIGWIKGYLMDRRVAMVYDGERARTRRLSKTKEVINAEERNERIRSGNIEVLRHRWKDIREGHRSFEIPRAGAMAYDFLLSLGILNEDPTRSSRAERLLPQEKVHPFVASLDSTDHTVLRKNVELRLFLEDLYNSGRDLGLPDTDMPIFV